MAQSDIWRHFRIHCSFEHLWDFFFFWSPLNTQEMSHSKRQKRVIASLISFSGESRLVNLIPVYHISQKYWSLQWFSADPTLPSLNFIFWAVVHLDMQRIQIAATCFRLWQRGTWKSSNRCAFHFQHFNVNLCFCQHLLNCWFCSGEIISSGPFWCRAF